jgi:acetoin:2,6-dichlorophenolindophenol oxidoreductase subunit alpha
MIGPSPGVGGGSRENLGVADRRRGLSSLSSVLEQSPFLALGRAYSQWLAGEGRVTLCVTRDRDVDSSDFDEAAKTAVLWGLPLVLVVESLRDVPSVRRDVSVRGTQAHRCAMSHGMPWVSVDVDDVEAVRDCLAKAMERASAGGGPTLVEAVTYRAIDRGGDNQAEAERSLDPLIPAGRRRIDAGVTRSQLYEVERMARHLVAEAEAFAKAMPFVE